MRNGFACASLERCLVTGGRDATHDRLAALGSDEAAFGDTALNDGLRLRDVLLGLWVFRCPDRAAASAACNDQCQQERHYDAYLHVCFLPLPTWICPLHSLDGVVTGRHAAVLSARPNEVVLRGRTLLVFATDRALTPPLGLAADLANDEHLCAPLVLEREAATRPRVASTSVQTDDEIAGTALCRVLGAASGRDARLLVVERADKATLGELSLRAAVEDLELEEAIVLRVLGREARAVMALVTEAAEEVIEATTSTTGGA